MNKFNVYGVEVADANEMHYVKAIVDSLHGASRYGDIATGEEHKKRDPKTLRYNKLAAIALKAVREAKKL